MAGRPRRDNVAIGACIAVLAATGFTALVLNDLAQPDKSAPTAHSATSSPVKHSEGWDAVHGELEYPGLTEPFVRGVNAQIPWTTDIHAATLVVVAQDACAASTTADAQAVVQEAGFTGPESALFVSAAKRSFGC